MTAQPYNDLKLPRTLPTLALGSFLCSDGPLAQGIGTFLRLPDLPECHASVRAGFAPGDGARLIVGGVAAAGGAPGERRYVLREVRLTAARAWAARDLALLPGGWGMHRTAAVTLPLWTPAGGDWVVALVGVVREPLRWLPPGSTSLQSASDLRTTRSWPAITDLDRDGVPEAWISIPGEAPDAPPRITRALLSNESDTIPLRPELTSQLRSARRILPWDFDEDQFEDLVLLGGRGRPLRTLESRGGAGFRPAEEGLPPGTHPERIPATEMRLGPVRGPIQWALSWGGRARLLWRRDRALVFAAHASSAVRLAGMDILDARILDTDADGSEELLFLGRRRREGSTEEPVRLHLWRLPDTQDEPVKVLARPLSMPGARGLRIGDLDADGAPDLLVVHAEGAPSAWRNTATAWRWRGIAVSVLGTPDRPHAIGSYLELWDANERLLRLRWPPLHPADQLRSWLTFASRPGADLPELRITWPEGNAETIEAAPGGQITLRR